ncbi:hypothetical protein SAMN06265338_104209 [Rhodoblastus acidophilus]|uniref:Uncharacterized protein n=2 Tax=Rhodoblastus acidophilus TaxID=1074 RepID=A0A212RHQ4_RHOAC|nr:hypothetical protein CKO16_04745 [Rhodoblastus acidophilus]RAI24337.1 hypothetical protein CH337_00125 [Rhodoblastus acidophilus]SNB71752.1 hypothetical protein SAMN06265338_104209 [Rhodoblastus acidophilus]
MTVKAMRKVRRKKVKKMLNGADIQWEEPHQVKNRTFQIVVYIDPSLPNSTCVEAFENGKEVIYTLAPGLSQRERHLIDHTTGSSYFKKFGTAGLFDLIEDIKSRLDKYA